MKVAFRISNMGYGGAERVFLSVADYIAYAHNVHIDFVVDRVGQGETERLIEEKGFRLVDLASPSTMASIIPLKKYLDMAQPDVLISAYTDTNLGAIISTRLSKSKCKVIVSEHASLTEHWQYARFIRRVLLNAYIKIGYHFAHHILAVSGGIAKQILAYGYKQDKVSYIYNPVRFNQKAIDAIEPVYKSESPMILAVGRITRQKDYLTLLKAFRILNTQQKARLVIVGGVHETAEKTKLDHYIKANHLDTQVEFVGFTENIAAYYAAADVFVLSSAWEGFGNVIVEALAFGLPVVSTNCNHGPAEILVDGQYGRLVSVGDSDTMAIEIGKVLAQRPFDKSAQAHRANDFSEAEIGEAYHQLFQKVMIGK